MCVCVCKFDDFRGKASSKLLVKHVSVPGLKVPSEFFGTWDVSISLHKIRLAYRSPVLLHCGATAETVLDTFRLRLPLSVSPLVLLTLTPT